MLCHLHLWSNLPLNSLRALRHPVLAVKSVLIQNRNNARHHRSGSVGCSGLKGTGKVTEEPRRDGKEASKRGGGLDASTG